MKCLHKALPWALFLIMLSVSCSSVPKEEEMIGERGKRAADYSAIAAAYYEKGQYQDALTFYSFALNEYVLSDRRKPMIGTFYDIARCHLASGRNAQAEEALNQGLRLSLQGNYPSLTARGEILSGEMKLASDAPEEALSHFDSAIALLRQEEMGDEEALGVALHNRGSVLSRLGDPAGAEVAFRESMELHRKLGRQAQLATNHYMLASLLKQQGRYQEAETELLEALMIDRALELSLQIADDLFALGSVQSKLQKSEKAYTSYAQSFMIYKSLELNSPAARALRRLAELSRKGGKEKKADSYIQAAQKLEEQRAEGAQQ